MNILSYDFLSFLIADFVFALYLGREICQEAHVLLPEKIRKRGRP